MLLRIRRNVIEPVLIILDTEHIHGEALQFQHTLAAGNAAASQATDTSKCLLSFSNRVDYIIMMRKYTDECICAELPTHFLLWQRSS
jgi:hypothetical protein